MSRAPLRESPKRSSNRKPLAHQQTAAGTAVPDSWCRRARNRLQSLRAKRWGRTGLRSRRAGRRLRLEWLEDRLAPCFMIVPHYGTTITSLPTAQEMAVEETINSACQIYDSYISNSIVVNVDFEINSGSIQSIGVAPNGGGSGYTAATSVIISAPTNPPNSAPTAGIGQQATASLVLSPTGAITGFTNIQGGFGYSLSSLPTVTLSGPGSGFVQGAVNLNLGLGHSSWYIDNVTYASYLAALQKQPVTANKFQAINSLPTGNSYPAPLGGPNGGTMVQLTVPLARALGYSGVTNANYPIDGVISLNSTICNITRPDTSAEPYDLLSVTLHELDEVLSGGSVLNGQKNTNNANPAPLQPINPLDLFRYTPPSVASGSGATVTFTVSGGAISSVTAMPAAGGSGYPASSIFNLYVSGGGGTGGVVQATTNASGVVTAFASAPITPGSGYTATTGSTTASSERSYNLSPNTNAEFSIDGGANDLARFNQTGGGDFSDWYSPPNRPAPAAPLYAPQVQDAFQTPGAAPNLDVELTRLDVLGYTLNLNPPDLTLKITNSVGGSTALGGSWTWTLQVENSGGTAANFGNGQRIVIDNLPTSNISYGTVPTPTSNNVTGTLSASITGGILTVLAGGPNGVSIAAGGSFDIVLTATATAVGTFTNPRIPGVAMVDPDGWIPEFNAGNNTGSNTVTVTASSANQLLFIPPNITDANAGSVSVSGTGIRAGDTIMVTIADAFGTTTAPASASVSAGGTWTVSGIDASALADGQLYYTATEGANTATFPALKGPPLGFTSAPDITDANVNNVTVSGTGCFNGDGIVVTVSDGTNTVTMFATISNGTWTVSGIDASGLSDGTITYYMTEQSAIGFSQGPTGNSSTVSQTATKTTSVLAFTRRRTSRMTTRAACRPPARGASAKRSRSPSETKKATPRRQPPRPSAATAHGP